MDFSVSRWNDYRSLCVYKNDVSFSTELLNYDERRELAYKLREAAFDLDNGEAKEYLNPGLEKALELVNDYLKDLRDDRKSYEATWVEVVRDHIKFEMES